MKQRWRNWVSIVLTLIAGHALAQSLERPRPWEVGDRLAYAYHLNGRLVDAVEEVVQIADARVLMVQRIGTRTYEAAYSLPDYRREKGICVANSQACSFEPGETWLDWPLTPGKTWSNSMTVSGETFVTGVRQRRTVQGLETITTPAGEFLAFRVSSQGTLTSRNRDGAGPWKGTEKSTYWWSHVKGKLVLVRQSYENSFGSSSSRELVSVEFR